MIASKEDEDVGSQIDRLNQVISRTLEDAKKAIDVTSEGREEGLLSDFSFSTYRRKVSVSHFEPVQESVEGSEISVDSAVQEYFSLLEGQLERAHMRIEDLTSRLQHLTVVLPPQQIYEFSQRMQQLETGQSVSLPLGDLAVKVVCRSDPSHENASKLTPVISAVNLRDKIEELVLDSPTENIPTTSTQDVSDSPVSLSGQRHESELAELRKAVDVLNPEEEETTAIRKELDRAEEISLGVASGQDPKKLYMQLALVQKGLLQLRGKKALNGVSKAISLISTINTPHEDELRRLQQSKSRILSDLLRKHSTSSHPPKPVIVTMETVSSAMDSPAASRIMDFDFLLDKRGFDRGKETELRKRLETVEDRVGKLRNLIREQQVKLQKYRDEEKRLIEDKNRVKLAEKRLDAYREILEKQGKVIAGREMEVAVKSDNLRVEAAEIVGMEEAREYLVLKAETLQQENHKIGLENRLLEIKKAEMEQMEEEMKHVRRLLQEQTEQYWKEREVIEKEKALVMQSKTELEEFLPLLRRYQSAN